MDLVALALVLAFEVEAADRGFVVVVFFFDVGAFTFFMRGDATLPHIKMAREPPYLQARTAARVQSPALPHEAPQTSRYA